MRLLFGVDGDAAMSRVGRLVRLGSSLELLPYRVDAIERALEALLVLQGTALARQTDPKAPLAESEFRVFSQFGEDGVIQHLIRAIAVPPGLRTFIEVGVENYTESNTRFLLLHDDWRGLVIDGGDAHVAHIRADPISWQHDLTAVHAFVTCDNFTPLLEEHGFGGDIGLLSLDVDGVDYWLLDRLEARPLILTVEYNAVFGARRAVTVPYRADFRRATAHWSHLYWGASLKALWVAAQRKGYELVLCNRAGNNAFFVRRDSLGHLEALDPETAWVDSKFRDSRDRAGNLSHVRGAGRRALIADLPLVDVESGQTVTVDQVGTD